MGFEDEAGQNQRREGPDPGAPRAHARGEGIRQRSARVSVAGLVA